MKSIWNQLFGNEQLQQTPPAFEVHVTELFHASAFVNSNFELGKRPWVVVCVCESDFPQTSSLCGTGRGMLVLDGMETK